MVHYVFPADLARNQNHEDCLHFEEALHHDARKMTVELLLLLVVLVRGKQSWLRNSAHGLLVDVVVDLCSQHAVEIVEATHRVTGRGRQLR